jgi:nucleotidyltransferase AbiEii toxin of type IV toxin-antitoxin system
MEFDEAIDLFAAFEREGVRYVLIGSMAMAVQGLVRATRDIDFFVASDVENVERLKRALYAVFADECIGEISSEDLAGPYPVIQYGPPDGGFVIDFIARLGEAFSFDGIEFETLQIEGVTVRVATPRMLYAMKRDTVRPQDRVDAEQIRERFGLAEEA